MSIDVSSDMGYIVHTSRSICSDVATFKFLHVDDLPLSDAWIWMLCHIPCIWIFLRLRSHHDWSCDVVDGRRWRMFYYIFYKTATKDTTAVANTKSNKTVFTQNTATKSKMKVPTDSNKKDLVCHFMCTVVCFRMTRTQKHRSLSRLIRLIPNRWTTTSYDSL